jgi:hypothetical protein
VVGIRVFARQEQRFEIRVASPDDLPTLLGFLRGTVYEPEPVDERTVAVTSPVAVEPRLARREVALYLRLLERLCPGLAADLVD